MATTRVDGMTVGQIKQAVLEVALKEYLTKRGFWPPPSKE
jgi:hypothetical protein